MRDLSNTHSYANNHSKKEERILFELSQRLALLAARFFLRTDETFSMKSSVVR